MFLSSIGVFFLYAIYFRVRDEVGRPWWLSSKVCLRCRRRQRPRFHPRVGESVEEGMAATPSTLAWRLPWRRRNLVGCSPQGHRESDATS